MEARQRVYDYLTEKNISFSVNEHPPVFTIEAMEELGLHLDGEIIKNLFQRAAKGQRHFLVMIRGDKKVDLKGLQAKIGSTRLNFASEERLAKYLGLEKGAVSPLGLLNGSGGEVEIIMDRDLEGCARLGVHPNDNRATVWLSAEDLKTIIEDLGNDLRLIDV